MSMTQRSFFDEGNRLALLSAMGDPLEVLDRAIKWEDFRSVIERNIRHPRSSKDGRPRFDVVLMFKSSSFSVCITVTYHPNKVKRP